MALGPRTVAQLPAARSALRSLLGCSGEPDDASNVLGEQLVLAFDELASNALRHGKSPVVATVVAGSGGWLLDVSDRARESMPAPAVDRDPAQGGMGLHLVARMSVAHGWYVDGPSKHVWACLPTAPTTGCVDGRPAGLEQLSHSGTPAAPAAPGALCHAPGGAAPLKREKQPGGS